MYGSGDFDAGQVDPLRRARVGSVCVAKNDVYGNELCLIDETITRLRNRFGFMSWLLDHAANAMCEEVGEDVIPTKHSRRLLSTP